jgi:hypothetical protein
MLRFKRDKNDTSGMPFAITKDGDYKRAGLDDLEGALFEHICANRYRIASGKWEGWVIDNVQPAWIDDFGPSDHPATVPDFIASAKPATHLSGPIHYLDLAKTEMLDRAATYDTPTGEKSMLATVEAFNAIMGRALDENGGRLTEAMGWEFMSILKKVRQFSRKQPHLDSATDDVAYTALAAEARMNEANA